MLNSSLEPWQVIPSLVNGITCMVATMGLDSNILVAVNAGISPEPLAANPIPVLLFVHVNDVAAPPKKIGSVVLSLQN